MRVMTPMAISLRSEGASGHTGETLADLLDARLQLVTLEKDDEHALVHLVTLQIEPNKI
jgi:hypothetical protein